MPPSVKAAPSAGMPWKAWQMERANLHEEIFVMNDELFTYIYRASVRLRNGKRIYAYQYGLKAFRIKIRKVNKQLTLI